ncbi:TetR/AcrR family transcriptional regulator [Rivularia sp. UHCC 0363]|uniref:TetR/AcrR family transcriptional regulator n=1 Tax=Rivularia sp. UHCC 0363 TaxID=3110244 RepID=UPI002B20355D|nr:TetR/AcrR family transcriptional regulator [Rivularia sp. UHCC 0363]MEA5595841.1 TetR/AcrR family transcriptional regulator [Rivularia sp. UHCC 0363]
MKQPQLSEKAESILKGAIQEFLVHGFAATSMDGVAAAAGVSKTTVYSHFQDKESLFLALIERLIKQKYQAVFNPQKARSTSGEVRVILRRLANSMLFAMMGDEEALGLLRIIIGESGRFPQLARAFVNNFKKSVLQDLTQFFESHQELNLPDTEVAARIFMGTFMHFVMTSEVLHGKDIMPIDQDRLINNLIYLLTSNQSVSATKHKSHRCNRSDSGKFESDYKTEQKRLRSMRLTDTAWEKLALIAEQHQLSRSEVIEMFARGEGLGNEE